MQVLNVADGLLEQLGDVFVVELVDDVAALSFGVHQPEVPEHTELVGHRRGLHADMFGEVPDRARTAVQTPEDADPARGGQRLHGVGDEPRESVIKRGRLNEAWTVTHGE